MTAGTGATTPAPRTAPSDSSAAQYRNGRNRIRHLRLFVFEFSRNVTHRFIGIGIAGSTA